MKTKVFFLLALTVLVITPGFSQEKTKKELKEERKVEKQKQIEAMVNSGEFVFKARTALPQGYKSVDLTTNPNFVKYTRDLITGNMPFYGRGYSGIGYGGDSGLKFEGKPEEYKESVEKNGYRINAVVKGASDVFKLSLFVGSEGSATLSVITNNRSPISYNGEIYPPETSEEKK
jgi:hypothetical protein